MIKPNMSCKNVPIQTTPYMGLRGPMQVVQCFDLDYFYDGKGVTPFQAQANAEAWASDYGGNVEQTSATIWRVARKVD